MYKLCPESKAVQLRTAEEDLGAPINPTKQTNKLHLMAFPEITLNDKKLDLSGTLS